MLSTAVTIVSGAVAERIHFHVYVFFVLLHSLVVYPILVRWTWNADGFLSARRDTGALFGCGVIDKAGYNQRSAGIEY